MNLFGSQETYHCKECGNDRFRPCSRRHNHHGVLVGLDCVNCGTHFKATWPRFFHFDWSDQWRLDGNCQPKERVATNAPLALF